MLKSLEQVRIVAVWVLTMVLRIIAWGKGYRTYATSTAAFLTYLSGVVGFLPAEWSQTAAVGLAALAAMFMRASVADSVELAVQSLLSDLSDEPAKSDAQ